MQQIFALKKDVLCSLQQSAGSNFSSILASWSLPTQEAPVSFFSRKRKELFIELSEWNGPEIFFSVRLTNRPSLVFVRKTFLSGKISFSERVYSWENGLHSRKLSTCLRQKRNKYVYYLALPFQVLTVARLSACYQVVVSRGTLNQVRIPFRIWQHSSKIGYSANF